MSGITPLIVATAAFVGTHFLLSHPFRGALAGSFGERGFAGLYSLVAIGTFVWMVIAYRNAPLTAPLWPVGDVLWAIVTLVMLIAAILFMGSLIKNPALPNPGAPATVPSEAKGVFAVTRHPMMWGFALWGFCHIAIFPIAANIVLSAGIIVLALGGAALQDEKKEKLLPETWPKWEAKTSYWPFAAIAQGRARLSSMRPHDWLGGLVIWLVLTWLHIPTVHVPAGIWRWV